MDKRIDIRPSKVGLTVKIIQLIAFSGNIAVDVSASHQNLPIASRRRKPCEYGGGCYRQNPTHKIEFSHPGDDDWWDPLNQDNTATDFEDQRPGSDLKLLACKKFIKSANMESFATKTVKFIGENTSIARREALQKEEQREGRKSATERFLLIATIFLENRKAKSSMTYRKEKKIPVDLPKYKKCLPRLETSFQKRRNFCEIETFEVADLNIRSCL